jgi:hypothetical protein
MYVRITSKGDFNNTKNWLAQLQTKVPRTALNEIGRSGVSALSHATPVGSTGETAAGWSYKVSASKGKSSVSFYNNSHPETSANVAMLIQNGHATKNGGYVPGRDYINPALQSIFSRGSTLLSEEMMK